MVPGGSLSQNPLNRFLPDRELPGGMTPASSSPVPPDDLLAHAGFVRGLTRALVSGDADVDDVVQETWVAALGSQGSPIRSPRSWLASIVRATRRPPPPDPRPDGQAPRRGRDVGRGPDTRRPCRPPRDHPEGLGRARVPSLQLPRRPRAPLLRGVAAEEEVAEGGWECLSVR